MTGLSELLAERTVTCIIFPNDVQELKYEEPARMHDTVQSGLGYSKPVIVPNFNDLQKLQLF